MAEYKKFGIEDLIENTTYNNSWFYKNQSSTSGSAYPYDETQTIFGATSTTQPTLNANMRSDGHICRVYDGNQYYYWWEVNESSTTTFEDWMPSNFTVESENSNFTSFDPDCVVLEKEDGTKEVVYGKMPTISIVNPYYDKDTQTLELEIIADLEWDYGTFNVYASVSPTPTSLNRTVSANNHNYLIFFYDVYDNRGEGDETFYVRVEFEGVYSNTASETVYIEAPPTNDWDYVQTDSAAYENYDIFIYTDEWNSPGTVEEARQALNDAYPSNNYSAGVTAYVENYMDELYYFTIY